MSLGFSALYKPDLSARKTLEPDCLLISTSLAKPSLGTKRDTICLSYRTGREPIKTLSPLLTDYYAETIPETTPFQAGAAQKNVPLK